MEESFGDYHKPPKKKEKVSTVASKTCKVRLSNGSYVRLIRGEKPKGMKAKERDELLAAGFLKEEVK